MDTEKINGIISNNETFEFKDIQILFDEIEYYNDMIEELEEDNSSELLNDYSENIRKNQELFLEKRKLEDELEEINAMQQRLGGRISKKKENRKVVLETEIKNIESQMQNLKANSKEAKKEINDIKKELPNRQEAIKKYQDSIEINKQNLQKIYDYCANKMKIIEDDLNDLGEKVKNQANRISNIKIKNYASIDEFNLDMKDALDELSKLQKDLDDTINYRNSHYYSNRKIVDLISKSNVITISKDDPEILPNPFEDKELPEIDELKERIIRLINLGVEQGQILKNQANYIINNSVNLDFVKEIIERSNINLDDNNSLSECIYSHIWEAYHNFNGSEHLINDELRSYLDNINNNYIELIKIAENQENFLTEKQLDEKNIDPEDMTFIKKELEIDGISIVEKIFTDEERLEQIINKIIEISSNQENTITYEQISYIEKEYDYIANIDIIKEKLKNENINVIDKIVNDDEIVYSSIKNLLNEIKLKKELADYILKDSSNVNYLFEELSAVLRFCNDDSYENVDINDNIKNLIDIAVKKGLCKKEEIKNIKEENVLISFDEIVKHSFITKKFCDEKMSNIINKLGEIANKQDNKVTHNQIDEINKEFDNFFFQDEIIEKLNEIGITSVENLDKDDKNNKQKEIIDNIIEIGKHQNGIILDEQINDEIDELDNKVTFKVAVLSLLRSNGIQVLKAEEYLEQVNISDEKNEVLKNLLTTSTNQNGKLTFKQLEDLCRDFINDDDFGLVVYAFVNVNNIVLVKKLNLNQTSDNNSANSSDDEHEKMVDNIIKKILSIGNKQGYITYEQIDELAGNLDNENINRIMRALDVNNIKYGYASDFEEKNIEFFGQKFNNEKDAINYYHSVEDLINNWNNFAKKNDEFEYYDLDAINEVSNIKEDIKSIPKRIVKLGKLSKEKSFMIYTSVINKFQRKNESEESEKKSSKMKGKIKSTYKLTREKGKEIFDKIKLKISSIVYDDLAFDDMDMIDNIIAELVDNASKNNNYITRNQLEEICEGISKEVVDDILEHLFEAYGIEVLENEYEHEPEDGDRKGRK